ncbi:MAG: hypothetical protein KCHDKBKB_01383 [Elusimicrobia bacterium]|nr:hypothetical protein [Elusimicrobiota bacterium]
MRIRFHLSTLIIFFLAWATLLHPVRTPLSLSPLLYSFVFSVFVVGLAWFFRKIDFDVTLSNVDLRVFLFLFLSFGLINFRFLNFSLGGDELYHGQRASSFWFFRSQLSQLGLFSNLPISLINSYLSLTLWLIFLFGCFLYHSMGKRISEPLRFLGYFISLVIVGVIFSWIRPPVEPHPPLRLLPLFIFQSIFGLNDFSFKLTGIFFTSMVGFSFYKVISMYRPGHKGVALLVSAAIMCIPTVLHASSIVEPSLWVFIGGTLAMLSFFHAHERNEEKYLIYGFFIVGMGVLFRQNMIIFWLPAFLFAWIKRRLVKSPLLLILPVFFSFPYFYSVAQIGHPVVSVKIMNEETEKKSSSSDPVVLNQVNPSSAFSLSEPSRPGYFRKIVTPLRNIFHSIQTIEGPILVLKSSDSFWVLLLFVGAIVSLIFVSTPLHVFHLILVIGYALFHSLFSDLWGMGRYQVEYIAPATALVILLLTVRPFKFHVSLLIIMGLLIAHSLFLNYTIPHDVYFSNKFKRRLSTEFIFPYKQSLDFIHGLDCQGKFVFLGAAPGRNEFLLWLRGFNMNDCDRFNSVTKKFDDFILTAPSLSDFQKFLTDNELKYFVVENGDKRERLNRPSELTFLMDSLEKSALVPQYSFYERGGGAIQIFSVN